MSTKAMFALAIFVFVGTTAMGQVPDGSQSSISVEIVDSILVVPDGTGELLSDAGGEIDVWLRDANGNPISGYPASQIQLRYGASTQAPHVGLCASAGFGTTGITATSNSDASGHTTVDGALFAGGGSSVGMVWMIEVFDSSGGLVTELPIDPVYIVEFVSPDLDWNNTVDLSDIAQFNQHMSSNNLAADFTGDDLVNLSDVVIISNAIGASCSAK